MPYIVMEYVEGQPLGSVLAADIRQYGAMPADKALKVTADVLAALETADQMGLVHRDIKPGNVMMTKRGIVKVMDFGIARAMQSGVTSMTQTGMVVGTPQYLSPNRPSAAVSTPTSDLYSVGIMLFQLLTGRIPFDADSPLAIAYAHVQEEPVAPSSINRSVTPAMDALVARALKKNPNERFPSAAAMRDEIARVLNASGGRTGAPAIVAGGSTANSGAGVGSAVFPPRRPGHPRAAERADPVPAAPAPAAAAPGPVQPAGPDARAGLRVPAGGPELPDAGPARPPDPAAVHGRPAAPDGRRHHGRRFLQRNMPVIVGSIVVALLAVGGLITALALQGGGKDDEAGKGGDPGTSETSTDEGYRPPERNRTMKSTKCTDALEDSDDPQKVQAPNFVYKDILSAKACAAAAGWTIKEIEEPGNTYAEGQVVGQFPSSGAAVAEQGAHFELKVSTGRPS
ncbi:non-specific serine/threonine protein kinase OS=Streptomyces microflavus OX=1919 GN=pksC PE=4 SV=1 [Streptomyces microflavus]